MSISGKFGIGHFEISLEEYEEALQYMYPQWLFSEKIEPRDTFPFKLYVIEPPKSYKGKSFPDIYIPKGGSNLGAFKYHTFWRRRDVRHGLGGYTSRHPLPRFH